MHIMDAPLSAWVQQSRIHIIFLNHLTRNTVSFAALFQGSQIRGNGFRNLFEYGKFSVEGCCKGEFGNSEQGSSGIL
jgi:hypothetical protein